MLAQKLGRKIAGLRKLGGFSQEQFAEATEYSVEFISLVERGINSPSISGIERIAKALNVEVKELFDFDGEVHK